MSVESLYRDVVMRHFKKPSHHGPVSESESLASAENPTCGDHMRLTLTVEEGRITDIRFEGKGCAISMASCSLMTEAVLGKDVGEVRELIDAFEGMLKGDAEVEGVDLGDLAALQGVKRYPLRIKCALLGWEALRGALEKTST